MDETLLRVQMHDTVLSYPSQEIPVTLPRTLRPHLEFTS